MENQKSKPNKPWIISLVAIILTALLGLGFLGFQYYSLNSSYNQLQDKLNSFEKANNLLSKEIASKENVLNEQDNKLKQQESLIGDLEKNNSSLKNEVSKLKVMKATPFTPSEKDLAYYKSQNTGPKICYLTFDDGPSDLTLKILNVLKTGNAKATFFVTGTSKLSYIKKATAEGHAIGLHTDTHSWDIYKSQSAYYDDLYSIRKKVCDLIGKDVNLIRFPGGSSNAKSKNYNQGIMTRLTKDVEEKGFYFFDWNVDSGDAAKNNVSVGKIISNIKREAARKTEICILMHDTNSKKTTVEALPYIISYLRGQGFRFEVLSENTNTFHHTKLYN